VKILVVDDEPDIRLIVRLSLQKQGVAVVEAATGADGVSAARGERPDAILLDVMMPQMDGPSTLDALRGDAATRDIPVIFLTAKAQRTEIERLRGLGALGVLTKPFDPITLADDVRLLLAGPAGED